MSGVHAQALQGLIQSGAPNESRGVIRNPEEAFDKNALKKPDINTTFGETASILGFKNSLLDKLDIESTAQIETIDGFLSELIKNKGMVDNPETRKNLINRLSGLLNISNKSQVAKIRAIHKAILLTKFLG